MSEIKKVVLAYSGGLDTSVIIPWLKEHYDNCEVIAVCGNVGQDDELDDLKQRAVASGASKLYVEDLTDEFVNEFVIPTMQAGADYEGYLLGTSLARPILAKRVVEIAKAEGADAVCHGSTGKGNDQVRFELAIMHFAPEMKIITPWREWDIQSRNEEIDYAEAHHIPLKINRETNYSKDKNLWHLSHEGLDLEDPGNEPQYEKEGFLEMSVSPLKAPDTPTYVELDFEKGVPVKLNGKAMKSSDIISKLNEIGGCKIEGSNLPERLEILGYLDRRITLIYIKDGVVERKCQPDMPEILRNVVKCTNPRCITSIEAGCDHIFKLSPSGKYRCLYCNQELPVQR